MPMAGRGNIFMPVLMISLAADFARLLVRERKQGIPFGAGEVTAALLAGKQHHKGASQQQAKEYGEWNDRHGVDMSA